MQLGEDCMAITWKCMGNQVCFMKQHLQAIMQATYSNSHHHIIAYKHVAQQMAKDNKVAPDATGQFGDGAQVVHLMYR
jgi:hypothetical protein